MDAVILTVEEFANLKTFSSAIRTSIALNMPDDTQGYIAQMDAELAKIEARHFAKKGDA